MKKFLSLIALAALCVAAASCQGKGGETGGLSDAEKAMKGIAAQYVPGVIYATYGDLAKESGELFELMQGMEDFVSREALEPVAKKIRELQNSTEKELTTP